MPDVRPIPFLDGYFASSDGRILSSRDGTGNGRVVPLHAMAGYYDKDGYRHVSLRMAGRRTSKRWPIHRLVAVVFIGQPPTPQHQVRHLNSKRDDNRAENLAWGTGVDNTADRMATGRRYCGRGNPNVRLSPAEVEAIRFEYEIGAASQDKLAAKYGIGQSQVSRIVRRQAWTGEAA